MPIKTVRGVTCSNCRRLYNNIDTGPYAETAKQARENARDYGNWVCKKVDGKMVDLCGRCQKKDDDLDHDAISKILGSTYGKLGQNTRFGPR